MQKSTHMPETLAALTARARGRALTDSAWAARAGIRKETLSRLRSRTTCDFATLGSLAQAVGARLGVLDGEAPATTPDGHFPLGVDRAFEQRLVELGASDDLDPARWSSVGPRFFMAGLAVLLASSAGCDRPALLALAEELHPGASEAAVFSRWLERSPVRPSRFLPLVDAQRTHAA